MLRLKIFLFIFMLVFAGCKNGEDIPTVRLGHAPHDHHAPLYIAAAKGIYFNEKCGVYLKKISYKKVYSLYKNDKLIANVQIDSSTGGIQLIRRLNEKILDVSFGGVPAMVSVIDSSGKIKIVAPVMTEGASLVVRKDMPVSNWNEFVKYAKKSEKPIKIGYKVDTSVQNLIFESALSHEKLSYSSNISSEHVNVQVINLHGPKNLLPSLQAGVIDGFVVMQPYPAIAVHSGDAKIVAPLSKLPPEGRWQDHPCCALAVGDDFMKDNKEVVDSLINLFAHAGQFIEENSYESAQITSEWLMTPLEVEVNSLPTIKFISDYNDSWDRGIEYWVGALVTRSLLSGEVKKAYESGSLIDVIYEKSYHKTPRDK